MYLCPRQRAILRQAKRQGDYLRPVGSKRAELERKQAGGSASGVLRGTKRPKVERINKQITAE